MGKPAPPFGDEWLQNTRDLLAMHDDDKVLLISRRDLAALVARLDALEPVARAAVRWQVGLELRQLGELERLEDEVSVAVYALDPGTRAALAHPAEKGA